MKFQFGVNKYFLAFASTMGPTLWLSTIVPLPKVAGHGLMESPPSRNWVCGVVTKPDHVLNGVAITPECGDAFDFQDGGYQFMSVLTHDVGRIGVTLLPNNVCGFDSETWFGGPTPWDAPMDWPTTPMTAGRNEIKWNIQWGSHFSDTEDFRYWITKADFVFDSSQGLTWSDFEDTPFCDLYYNDANPSGNPDVIPLKDTVQFRTFCNVPVREGHHVIYGEWGRTQSTSERFHGCIDVTFDGTSLPPPDDDGTGSKVQAFFTYQPDFPTFEGAGTMYLDATASTGNNLSFAWSITTQGDGSIYSIDNSSASTAMLTLLEPSTAQQVTISLLVTSMEGSSTYTEIISHVSSTAASIWMDFGLLQPITQDLPAGTRVYLQSVDLNGNEMNWPASPLIVDDTNRLATNWPVALSNLLESEKAKVAVGILDTKADEVIAEFSTTNNRVYGYVYQGFTLVQLQFGNPPPAAFPTSSPIAINPSPPTPAPVISPTITVPTNAPADGDSVICLVHVRFDSNNPWHGGMDIGFDIPSIVLDFTNTGLDLSLVTPQAGVFASLTVVGKTQLILTKPSWLSKSNPGYLGIGGNNVEALGTFTAPTCSAVE